MEEKGKEETGGKSDSPDEFLRARVTEFAIPPIRDGLVLGKRSPIGCGALQKALSLLSVNQFDHIELKEDDVISDVFIRASILRKLPREKLTDFILRRVKPLMNVEEVLHLDLEVEVVFKEQL